MRDSFRTHVYASSWVLKVLMRVNRRFGHRWGSLLTLKAENFSMIPILGLEVTLLGMMMMTSSASTEGPNTCRGVIDVWRTGKLRPLRSPGDDRAAPRSKYLPPCTRATNTHELNIGPPLRYLNHDSGEVFPGDCCGSCQALRNGDLATAQETRNTGKGQFRPLCLTLRAVLLPNRLFG